MTLSLDDKRKNRFLLLKKLYDLTDGVADRHGISIREVGKELGMNDDAALNTFSYLEGEGLTKWMALGGIGTISHWGIKEVEDALDHKPTAHFPGDILILLNSPGASVVSGTGHQVSQGTTTFDQRGQQVHNQKNAARDINIGAIQNSADLVSQLDLLKQELAKARESNAISELTESKARTPLLEAIEEAQKPVPDKQSLLSHLGSIEETLKGITAAGGIIEFVTKAYEWVSRSL